MDGSLKIRRKISPAPVTPPRPPTTPPKPPMAPPRPPTTPPRPPTTPHKPPTTPPRPPTTPPKPPTVPPATANGGGATPSFTLSPQEARTGDVITFRCKQTDNGKRIFKITIHAKDGDILVPGEFVDAKNKIYEAKYEMNLKVNTSTTCATYKISDLVNKMQENQADIIYISSPDDDQVSMEKPGDGHTEAASNGPAKPPDYMLYGIIAASILIIAILIIAIWRTCRKPKVDSKQRSSVNYENFSNEPPVQTPAFPATAKLEETYLCPADCQAPKNADTETYAQPYIPKIEELYSQPVPKNARFDPSTLYTQVLPKNQRNGDINDTTYAEIQVKSVNLKGDKYANVDDASPYATVGDIGYANLGDKQNKDYTNVFTNEKYCNSKSKSADYAEPAYCQINRK